MTDTRLLKAAEVAVEVGCSVQTISGWYRFKRTNPESELAKKLPDYQLIGRKNTRYWTEEDVIALIDFQKAIPQGRNGLMGSVTQKYVVKKGEDKKGRTRVTINNLIEALRNNSIDEDTISSVVADLIKIKVA